MFRRFLRFWRRAEQWPWWARRPLKLAIFAITVTLVLYPKLWLLPEWWRRTQHVERVIDPDYRGLAVLEAQVRQRLKVEPGAPQALLRAVEQVVCQRIRYAYDWDVWGVMDYVPTVAEVLALGREDCDGRAVLAAALLRRMGCDAWLVSDVLHVWVATPIGETMRPGRGEQTLVADERGTHARWTLQTLANLGRGIAFGIGVFPLGRELIIIAVLCGLSIGRGAAPRRRALGCALLLGGFVLLRLSGEAVGRGEASAALFPAGVVAAGAGWLLLVVRAGVWRRRSPAGRPG